jgi:uncharacterized protein (DUF2126 family)/transglutaminase-like putative cysteine protease
MAIHCSLHHLTCYRYEREVTLAPQVIRLRPAPHSRTPVLSYSLRVTPEKHYLNWQQDPQGNFLARVVFPEPVKEFRIEVDLVAELAAINPFDFFLEEGSEHYPFVYSEQLLDDLRPYLVAGKWGEKFLALKEGLEIAPGMSVNDFMVAVNLAVHGVVGYTIRLEPGVQSPDQTLRLGTGSCRDSAWLLVQLMRELGVAARFCSGYLIQLKADQKPVDGGLEGPVEDFTDLHAWAEIYLPGAGWVGLDPTSGLLAGEGHIPLCATVHYANSAPISGAILAAQKVRTDFDFAMRVERVRETPRVTLPYSEEQVASILALGEEIDEVIMAGDMRLTMGGEPTFVSEADMEAPEWNTDALGPTKELYADQLLRRLFQRFAPGGFLFHGQGKWYPGEALPRWAYSAYWRPDGLPVWDDPGLIADHRRDYGHDVDDGEAFARRLAENLGLTREHLMAGFEDIFYYLWKERRLPMNVTVEDPRLEDPLERETLTKIFDRGLGSAVGHLLPLARRGGEWVTGSWFLRGEQLFLVPGNHPMGFRLPLDGLPWAEKGDLELLMPMDPTVPREPLPAGPMRPLAASAMGGGGLVGGGGGLAYSGRALVRGQREGEGLGDRAWSSQREVGDEGRREPAPAPFQSVSGQVRTGLCVEAREGRLNVFLPPMERLEDYLELVGAVELTASELGLPVRLEGYRPPPDPRLASFSVTPDPGVIEVNIHPSSSWGELVDKTRAIYEEARLVGLGTEKFLADGRHSGTGGGNHIVVGGEVPLDSPFLRRPAMLASLVRYFTNHPSLSYLFSGLFIGPTSQAPRLDEARHEALYELETALGCLPGGDSTLESTQWIIDRVLRNHLVDMTGNTHRSELCIDKLYSPEGSGGRLGLVEMRGFEMPPHPDMSLAQQLLVRGLLARFWERPYEEKIVRWGSSIHDRWLLPHFLWEDLEDILDDLRQAGFAFEDSWFEPHLEFRFPLVGEYVARGVQMELRQAIEPWHVLGEEQGRGGTARYVDSSVERVQLLVKGLVDGRHVVTCNGVAVPLHPTGRQGEFVAGVRYRAWAPHSALHPRVPIHSPLTFDLVDRWSRRSLGGCQYHVVHPGGRAYEDIPSNAFVAESRRRSRYFPMNRTPGRIDPASPVVDKEYPLTLDLQRHPV